MCRAAVVAAFILAGAAPAIAQPKTDTVLDQCLPAELREDAITFKTEDNIVLPGLVFGSGSSGVVLAHGETEQICAWLPLARQLADDGFQVLLHQSRSPLLPREARARYDRDVLAAAKELDRRGASSIVIGGAGTSAAAIASIASKVQNLKGVFLLTPLQTCRRTDFEFDTLAGIESVQAPVFVAAAQDDVVELKVDHLDDVRLADDARAVAGAAPNDRLEIVPGKARGVELMEDAALRDEVRAFAREVAPPPSFAARWWPLIAGGVVMLVGVLALVIFWRRRLSTARPEAVDTVWK